MSIRTAPLSLCPLLCGKRLDVFHHVPLLLLGQPQAERDVVVIDYVEQCGKAAIVVISPFVLGAHEPPVLTHEASGQVHGLVSVIGCTITMSLLPLRGCRSDELWRKKRKTGVGVPCPAWSVA